VKLSRLENIFIERERERDLQHFADIASTKNLVNNGKLVRVVRREVRCKDAVLGAAASQQLAGCTG
jgi:hypothetical protein